MATLQLGVARDGARGRGDGRSTDKQITQCEPPPLQNWACNTALPRLQEPHGGKGRSTQAHHNQPPASQA
eukprot:CAMPEP_0177667186 /NCGR_PEP_ID=MMETSP0447-20121125/21984_1 /TAXON_ID=0 /ORGANISM="Stygamoeba regulata, Strain BSH-02190019" /LENGTH=69 /DNA_ID=CAMNT_0019173391 /DNA_START=184 /DNA_END=393 /DNA_ORIENTATION=-